MKRPRSFSATAVKIEAVNITPESARGIALEVIALATGVPSAAYESDGNLCVDYRERGDIETRVLRPAVEADLSALAVIRAIYAMAREAGQ